ncbi:MAG: PadR family transcriptional regulator [Thermoleophilia bacterium]|nr:PadR family transcriptional regulator [Thermoleophilia bacterium]
MERSQLLRGVLDVAVMAVIAERDGYGYDIQRRLTEAGFDGMGEATIYGTLRRLYRAGSLSSYSQPSDEGPHRRYYGLTDAGRRQLDDGRSAWTEFSDAVGRLLATQDDKEGVPA